jgi:hypothetical protein
MVNEMKPTRLSAPLSHPLLHAMPVADLAGAPMQPQRPLRTINSRATVSKVRCCEPSRETQPNASLLRLRSEPQPQKLDPKICHYKVDKDSRCSLLIQHIVP